MKAIKFCIAFFLLSAQLFFSSCDNREDYFIGVNTSPTLTLIKNGVALEGNTLSDSLKIAEPYSLHYFITDEENIRIQVIQEQQQSTVDAGSEVITITGITEGQSLVTLMVKDSFNEEARFSFLFTVFRNIAPVALFTVNKIGISSPYEYEIDASGSYDKDAKFNGKIVEYEYTLANYKFSSPLKKVRYIFGSSGQKQIRVRVKDNNGDWSSQVSLYVVIN